MDYAQEVSKHKQAAQAAEMDARELDKSAGVYPKKLKAVMIRAASSMRRVRDCHLQAADQLEVMIEKPPRRSQ